MITTDTYAAEAAAIAAMRASHCDGQLHRRVLNAAMDSAFAGTDAVGRWTQRQRNDLLEVAVLRNLQGTPVLSRADVIAIAGLAAALPTQTVRSEEQMMLQQFSTPIELAALIVWLAQPGPDDVVLEPSAGHGALVTLLPPVKQLQLSELDESRARRLADSFPNASLRHDDGAMIAATHAELPRPSLVLMNPPFARSRGCDVDPLAAARHLHAALTRLLPGGRLVAIMPDSFAPTGPHTDDTGEKRSSPMFDAAGRPVHNPEAEQARDCLIEHVCALPPIRPALDAIIERFGTDAVAEVTGRTRRLVPGRDGQQLESRSPRLAQADAAAFMDGRKRILIFSDAGGTGRSYHASLDAKNQQQRVHFLLEPGWRADRAIQGLGRTHRTHQANTPLFRPVTTNCKGELRFTSTIARRLDALGALTRGQRQTGGQNLFDPADNLESEYAKAALTEWFHRLNSGKLQSTTMGEFSKLTGLELLDGDGVLKEELPPIQRWLNRLLALRIATQNAIFDEFLGIVDKRVSAARDSGKLDIGVETILVDRASVIEDKLLRTDPRSNATTHLLTLEIERKRSVMGLDKVLAIADEAGIDTFVRNARSGNVALVREARSWMDDDGGAITRIELQRPARREFMLGREFTESAWEPVSRETFAAAWSAEAEAIAMIADREVVRLATGLLLPIWAALPDDYLEVNRIATPDGQSWLGRLVWERDIAKLLTKLGLAADDDLPSSTIAAAVLGGRIITISRPFPATLRRAKVNDQQRIELVGAPAARLPWLKSLGCYTEIIQWKTRVFLPVDRGAEIVAAIVDAA